jgi:hypothetical protein
MSSKADTPTPDLTALVATVAELRAELDRLKAGPGGENLSAVEDSGKRALYRRVDKLTKEEEGREKYYEEQREFHSKSAQERTQILYDKAHPQPEPGQKRFRCHLRDQCNPSRPGTDVLHVGMPVVEVWGYGPADAEAAYLKACSITKTELLVTVTLAEAPVPDAPVSAVASAPPPLRMLPPGAADAAPPAEVDAHLTPDRARVRAAIRQAGRALTIPEIAQAVGRDNYDAVAQTLHRMCGEGLLLKEARGMYALPAAPSTPPAAGT